MESFSVFQHSTKSSTILLSWPPISASLSFHDTHTHARTHTHTQKYTRMHACTHAQNTPSLNRTPYSKSHDHINACARTRTHRHVSHDSRCMHTSVQNFYPCQYASAHMMSRTRARKHSRTHSHTHLLKILVHAPTCAQSPFHASTQARP